MKTSAYSLIEVLIAGAILAIGIAAAALLTNTMLLQHEASTDVTRGMNVQERVSKLYHLGVATNAFTNVLPEVFSSTNPPGIDRFFLGFSAATTNNGAESVTCTNIFSVGSRQDGTVLYRTNTNTLSRETIR